MDGQTHIGERIYHGLGGHANRGQQTVRIGWRLDRERIAVLAPTNERRRNRWGFLAKALLQSRLPLIVRNLVGFMYFKEAVPAAKCDTLANTYL